MNNYFDIATKLYSSKEAKTYFFFLGISALTNFIPDVFVATLLSMITGIIISGWWFDIIRTVRPNQQVTLPHFSISFETFFKGIKLNFYNVVLGLFYFLIGLLFFILITAFAFLLSSTFLIALSLVVFIFLSLLIFPILITISIVYAVQSESLIQGFNFSKIFQQLRHAKFRVYKNSFLLIASNFTILLLAGGQLDKTYLVIVSSLLAIISFPLFYSQLQNLTIMEPPTPELLESA